jgi:hypothetical protein
MSPADRASPASRAPCGHEAAHKSSFVRTTALQHYSVEEGATVAGAYRRRVDLASGRFAMIDDGLGFSLVPWSPSLERHLGHDISGLAQAGRIEWSFGRARGLGIS